MTFLRRVRLTSVAILAACGGSDNTAMDGGADGSTDSTVADTSNDTSSGDTGANDAGANDAASDAPSDSGTGDVVNTCTPLPDASFGCGGGVTLKCSEYQYCLGGGVMNSCQSNPSQCDCVETHDCTCLKAHFVSPCDGGGGTWSCSNVNDAGDLWMLGSCL